MRAAHNSSRGMDSCFLGATWDLAIRKDCSREGLV